jgi:hypothetical protein
MQLVHDRRTNQLIAVKVFDSPGDRGVTGVFSGRFHVASLTPSVRCSNGGSLAANSESSWSDRDDVCSERVACGRPSGEAEADQRHENCDNGVGMASNATSDQDSKGVMGSDADIIGRIFSIRRFSMSRRVSVTERMATDLDRSSAIGMERDEEGDLPRRHRHRDVTHSRASRDPSEQHNTGL